MRLLFRLRTGSAEFLEDKKRCKIILDEMCESGAGEDVEHLLVMCGELGKNQWVLADKLNRIVGAGESLEEYGVYKEGKVSLVLGRVIAAGKRCHCCWEKCHCCWEMVWRE